MRCAASFDEDTPLCDQSVSAWGEMQSLEEEPEYKESDIKDDNEKEFFKGFKVAFDNVVSDLNNLVDEEVITESQSERIQYSMSCDLAMMLFSIIDHQDEE